MNGGIPHDFKIFKTLSDIGYKGRRGFVKHNYLPNGWSNQRGQKSKGS